MKAEKAWALVALGALAMGSCTNADYATNSDSEVVLLMTTINGGVVLESDVAIGPSSNTVCADFVPLRLENHFKNPNVTATGFRHDFTLERYEVHYFRSDGRNVEGVDVPYSITGNLAAEVIEESSATVNIEAVRAQAKLEPPLRALAGPGGFLGGSALIITMFAEITVHARNTTGGVDNPVTGRMQIDFADFGDSLTACPAPPGGAFQG